MGGICSFLARVVVALVVTVEPRAAVAAGDGVHGELLPLSAQDYRARRTIGGVATGGPVPHGAGVRGRRAPVVRVSAVECIGWRLAAASWDRLGERSAASTYPVSVTNGRADLAGVARLGTARAARASSRLSGGAGAVPAAPRSGAALI